MMTTREDRKGGTYSKFAYFRIVDTMNLRAFCSAQAQARDKIHNEQDDAGSAKRIGET